MALFFATYCLKRNKISNIAHVLSRILKSLAKLSNILGFTKSFQRDI